MILCAIQDVEPGMALAAAVFHPARPDRELLEPDVVLEPRLLRRLKQIGVREVWVHHDAAADLDRVIDPTLGRARRAAYEQLKGDFKQLSDQTLTTAHIQNYRKVVMDLVCELTGGRTVAGLTEQLVGGPTGLFTHGANVAYISVLIGLELETYVVGQRDRLSHEHARDLTSLGIGAMLHDIGKVALPQDRREWHELNVAEQIAANKAQHNNDEPADDPLAQYHHHVIAGYQMLRGSRAPAPATQVVLNHHQRWDGSGFPDMSDATDRRREGTQQGEAIHIFSRIVAAANVLEHLLRDVNHNTLPPVAALAALASGRFEGWFDPVVRDAVLRRLPPFAIGTRVTLSDGRLAVVIRPSVEQPCRPTVRLIGEADRAEDGSYVTVDLRITPELSVAACGGHDVRPYLFTLDERKPLRQQRTAG
ncbi:MAG: HD domain-containing phosphohydrolase [Phycisphaeraceae bacterium]